MQYLFFSLNGDSSSPAFSQAQSSDVLAQLKFFRPSDDSGGCFSLLPPEITQELLCAAVSQVDGC